MRTYTVEDSEPVTSAERAKTPSVVPPFSFIGQATTGLSGYWSPPHSLMLWNGYVTSAEFGSSEGGWVIMKEEPFNPTSVLLGAVNLAADRKKAVFEFDNKYLPKLVHPADRLFVACLADSGHESITVQMFGFRI